MITNTTYRVLVEKIGGSDPSEFIGNEGELFYDPSDLVLRLSDGTTTGGVEVASGGGGGGGAQGIQGIAGQSITIVGSVSTDTNLNPTYLGNIGDGYITQDTGNLWVWDGSEWDNVGQVKGPQGSQGVSGDQGIQGSEGYQGVQGTQGESIQGAEGSQGVQGIQGLWGDQGIQGVQGILGEQGVQGEAIQGIEGSPGAPGSDGSPGLPGSDGAPGSDGSQGVQGVQGEAIQGTEGSQGIIGEQGVQGVQGVQGEAIQGTEGSQGIIGEQGVQGVQGDQGVQGIVGESIQGTEGSQGIIGEQGVQGVQGDQGVQGEAIQGTEGSQGILGEQGVQGVLGEQGVQGIIGESIQGTEGSQGVQGVQGVQGEAIQGIEGSQGIQGEPGTPGGGGGESYWELDNVGIHTTSSVGIGTTTADATKTLTVVGNTKISDITISGTQIIGNGDGYILGDIQLIPNDSLTGQGQYVKIRPTAAFDQSHIHIEAGNVDNADLYLGNDDRFVKIDRTGPVVVGVPSDVTTSNWIADDDVLDTAFITIDTINYPWAKYLTITTDTVTLPDTTVVNISNISYGVDSVTVYLDSNISYLTSDVLVFSYRVTTEWSFNPNSSAIFPGSLGIGSTNPSVALDVNGDIHAVGFVTAAAFVGDGSNLRSVSGTHLVTYASASNISNSSETISGISTYTQVGILTGSSASNIGDSFGYSVTMTYDGSTLIIGAPVDELSGSGNYGVAYVFDRTGDSFKQVGILTGLYATDSNDNFGTSSATSADGRIIAIGAPNDGLPGGLQDSGIVYIFDREYDSIKLSGIITAGEYSSEQSAFGYSLSMSEDGNTLVVGAYNDTDGTNIGKVYVYDRIGNDWNRVGILTYSGTSLFGYSVSTNSNGRVIVVGDSNYNNGIGSAFVYDRIGQDIELVGILTGSSSGEFDNFGYSLDISSDGKIIAISAPIDEKAEDSLDSGLIYIYERTGNVFDEVGIITGANAEALGNSISISADGSTIIAGNAIDNVYVYNKQGNEFNQVISLSGQYTNGNDGYGFSAVSISGDGKTIAVGAPYDELSSNTGYGLVYVYNQERHTYVYSTPEGNIGINSSSPTEKLDVDGNLKVSGSVNAAGGFISMGSTTPINIELFGDQLVFTAAGIGSTSFTLYPAPEV